MEIITMPNLKAKQEDGDQFYIDSANHVALLLQDMTDG
jgi:hypothetical protein